MRDEAIACLALTDLKENKNAVSSSLSQTNLSEFNPELGISATAETNGSVVLRKVNNGRIFKTLPGPGLPVTELRFSPVSASKQRKGAPSNPGFLLVEYDGGSQNQIVVWDWQQGKKLFQLPHGIHAGAIDFSIDSGGGGKLAIGQHNGRVVVYSLPGGEVLRELELKRESGFPRAPQVVRFNPSGDLLAESCLYDPNVQVWDLSTGQTAFRLYHPDKVFDLSWHPQGELLATACGDACIYLWNTNRTDKPMKKLIGHENGVRAIAFNHSGSLLATTGMDETLRLWVPATDRQMIRRLEGDIFERLQFSSDDRLLSASELSVGSLSEEVTHSPVPPLRRNGVWEVSGDEYIVLQLRTGLAEKLRNIDFSPDGRWLAAASGERTMVWDASSGRELGAVNFAHAHGALFSADGRHLFASTDNGLFQCTLTERTNGNNPRLETEPVQRLTCVADELGTMALSLDRAMAAIVHQDELCLLPVSLALSSPSSPGRDKQPTNFIGRPIHVGNHYHWLALHPEGFWMAAMMRDSDSVHVWNLSQNLPVLSREPGAKLQHIFLRFLTIPDRSL